MQGGGRGRRENWRGETGVEGKTGAAAGTVRRRGSAKLEIPMGNPRVSGRGLKGRGNPSSGQSSVLRLIQT